MTISAIVMQAANSLTRQTPRVMAMVNPGVIYTALQRTPLDKFIRTIPEQNITKRFYHHPMKDQVKMALKSGKTIHCPYGGEKMTANNVSIEHILPKSKGGKVNWNNIMITCPKHNSARGNRDFDLVFDQFPEANHAIPHHVMEVRNIIGHDKTLKLIKALRDQTHNINWNDLAQTSRNTLN